MSQKSLTVKESALLQLNRQISSWLGLDPRHTISTNISLEISRATGISFEAAKQLFHAGVAGGVGKLASKRGATVAEATALGLVAFAWFESYDSSSSRR
jgi:hypothetical protein